MSIALSRMGRKTAILEIAFLYNRCYSNNCKHSCDGYKKWGTGIYYSFLIIEMITRKN